jgi:hypothetical protein
MLEYRQRDPVAVRVPELTESRSKLNPVRPIRSTLREALADATVGLNRRDH